MLRLLRLVALSAILILVPTAGRAGEIALSQIIVDFEADHPLVQDVEVENLGDGRAYVEVGLSRIANPGQWPMERQTSANPAELGLMVTPARFVLPGNGRRLLRLIATEPPGDVERVYRVAVVPKVGEVTDQRSGVKVVVGYEMLVIVRPRDQRIALEVVREGKVLRVRNTGNTNVLIPTVRQCGPQPGDPCANSSGTRVYPGRAEEIKLPRDAPVELLLTAARRSWTEKHP